MSPSAAAPTPLDDPFALDPDAPIELPGAWTAPPRPGVPILAAVVPVLGAVAIWLVTGSILALWLAALGPLLAAASVLDQRRVARRDRRAAVAAAAAARERAAAAIAARHGRERAQRWVRHPDCASLLAGDDIWRAMPGRAEALVLGAGEVPSDVRVSGGAGDPESVRLRAAAARLSDGPVAVPVLAGVAVSGPARAAEAVRRALALQLCLAFPPGELRLRADGEEWTRLVPHRFADAGSVLALVDAGEPVPADADIVLALVEPDAPPPPRCAAMLRLEGLGRGTVSFAGERTDVSVEAIGPAQATAIARDLAARAAVAFGRQRADEPVALAPLLSAAPPARRGTLPAVIGREADAPAVIDLVSDGPHAVVAGMTGSGKSELLISWVLALSAAHSTTEVSFLLADFKGGTAFEALTALPHVTGVLTDLDGQGARRALESLRAEVRWRESTIAAAGARDIRDPRVSLPRLVIVVDEFAALLGDHPELHALFVDVAARGRALGMHLVLGTQRAAGVIRDNLLANCPLRISLRVADPIDSRSLLGVDDAAQLSGGPEARGVALVRRASDSAPRRVRVALSEPADVGRIANAAAGGPRPRRPWLPALPARVPLEDLLDREREPGVLVLGLADEPEHQRQRLAGVRAADRGLLVVGGAGSGRSTALAVLAAQHRGAVQLPHDAEAAWDELHSLVEAPPSSGGLIVIDDLDVLPARFPPEYAPEVLDLLERVLRGAGAGGYLVAASTRRLGGATARLFDLLPHRLLLATRSRADHFAAGGESGHFEPDAPPGRGRLDGVAVQVAEAPVVAPSGRDDRAEWMPRAALTGFVARRSPATRAVVAAWEAAGVTVVGVDEWTEAPAGGTRMVVVGDPDGWQRRWRALAEMRSDHDVVVDASCASELRLLTGSRVLPPYCDAGRARAWLLREGADPVRIVLPSDDVRSDRP
ncbi:FtsK/SpoIIIE domain-containing protein [Microbacterium hominis]|uniref:Cell division protein FtsK n=1 Tax=Microbacterium hominis TaxID=162426 RepID=A0A7D4U8C7_9MICO|nr:FtsK/SpoIIIE domain-containing protein [Microbacterium hominis]QKJ19886.1 cell division protein FtsK [Microbacterium hominis]